MGILDFLFGKKADPAGDAGKYINQIPGAAHAGYDPYINAGLDAGGKTKSKYEEMFSDPEAFMNHLMSGYTTSEGYNFKKDLLEKELGNAANAGGIAGTPADVLGRGSAVQGLLSEDMQQYLSNLLGINKTGLEGGEHIADRGFEAGKALTDAIGGSLNQKGGLAFQSGTQKNTDRNDWISTLAKALGAVGGGIFGGPGGAAAGAKLGGGIFGGK